MVAAGPAVSGPSASMRAPGPGTGRRARRDPRAVSRAYGRIQPVHGAHSPPASEAWWAEEKEERGMTRAITVILVGFLSAAAFAQQSAQAPIDELRKGVRHHHALWGSRKG